MVIGISDAPIPWPCCRSVELRGGRSGLLLAGGLVRAVRHEAAAAVCCWWHVGREMVWRRRKALDVTRRNNEGTRRLNQAATELGAAGLKARE